MTKLRVIGSKYLPTRPFGPVNVLWMLWVTDRLLPLPAWVFWPIVTIELVILGALLWVSVHEQECSPADFKEGV